MIKYNLKCDKNHEFESWFSDSTEYEKLKKKNLLECIYCSSNKIQKSIMAPMITGAKSKAKDEFSFESPSNNKDKLLKLRDFVENNFEYVGEKFSEKARELYYDKKNNKSIYGTTTPKEKEELLEEGIDLISIPWARKDN
tara:strand:+ start:1042 stop:1461 length:420 start_codon:yes stop_codon:yes gene_type:complete